VQGHAVVVVAEGAAQELLALAAFDGPTEGPESSSQAVDKSGNKLLADVGPWLCKTAKDFLDTRPVCDRDKVTHP